MTRYRNNAEGGTNGVAATTANTGGTSGTAASGFPGTVAPTFTTAAINGNYSYQFQAASGATAIWDQSITPVPVGTTVGVRVSINVPTMPTQATEIVQIRPASGVSARIFLTSSGKIQLNDGANAIVYTSTNTLTANTPYDIVFKLRAGTTTSNGALSVSMTNIGTGNFVESPYASTAANAGTSAITLIRFGKLTATTWASAFVMDTLTIDDNVPWSGAPIVSAGADQSVASGSTVNLNGAVSAAFDVALPTIVWTLTSGPAATLADSSDPTTSYVSGSSGSQVWTLTATDSAGNAGTDSVTVVTSAASSAPLVLNFNVAGPCYVVDTRNSVGDPANNGAKQWEAVYVSGAHLDNYQVVPGFFVFLADDTDDGVYNINFSQVGNSSPQSQQLTFAAISATGTAPSNTAMSINETVVFTGGQWV